MAEGGRQLFLRRQRDFAFSQCRIGRIALLAQCFQPFGQLRHLYLPRAFLRFRFVAFGLPFGAHLRAFPFLGGETLDFINDGLHFLQQQPLRILKRAKLAFVCGNGYFLGAQFRLGLLQTGLQFDLFFFQGAATAADFGHFSLQFFNSAAQFGNLISTAKDRAGSFSIAIAVVVPAGVNAVGAQQVASQCNIVKTPVSLAPGSRCRVQITHDLCRPKQALDHWPDGSFAFNDFEGG